MEKPSVSWSDFEADDPTFQLEAAKLEVEDEEDEDQENEEEEDEEEDELPQDKKKIKKASKADPVKEEKKKDTKAKKPKEEPKLKDNEILGEEEEVELEEEGLDEEEEEVNPLAFFEEVEKITGQPVEVDYGDSDPASPNGVALREKAIREQALDNFLTEIEEKYPVAFKALNHAYAGGNVADLFKQTTTRDYTKVTLAEGDEDTAKEILREYYRSRGVKNEAKINKMIEADEDSTGGIIAEATTALQELSAEQVAKREEIIEEQKQRAVQEKQRDDAFVGVLDKAIGNRQLGTFRIPDKAEADQFLNYVLGNIRKKQDGTYELAALVDSTNFEKQLQYQYFQFKNGDLSKIIRQKASTLTAQKLKLRATHEADRSKRATEQEQRVAGASIRDFEN